MKKLLNQTLEALFIVGLFGIAVFVPRNLPNLAQLLYYIALGVPVIMGMKSRYFNTLFIVSLWGVVDIALRYTDKSFIIAITFIVLTFGTHFAITQLNKD